MKNPILNALGATLYIVGVVHMMQYLTQTLPEGSSESILVPIGMLSLFVLSVAVMAYLFILPGAELYLSGKKAEGVRLFLGTVLVFAICTGLLVSAMLYDGIKRGTHSTPKVEERADLSDDVEAFGREL